MSRVIHAKATGEDPEVTLEVTVKGLAQSRVNCQQLVKACAEDAFMDVWDTVPATTEVYEEVDCPAVLRHGPGHQSTTRCTTKRPHQVHYAEVNGEIATWIGEEATSGYFDELPEEE